MHIRRWALPVLLAVLLLAVLPEPAWSRAGGGGGYSGGGGGGRSGGGFGGGRSSYRGNGGSGEAVAVARLLSWLLIEHPAVGLPLTIVVAGVVIFGGVQGKRSHEGSVIRRGSRERELNRAHDALQVLQERDASFDMNAFRQRVTKAFLTCQEAWCAQKLEPIRPFVSDSIHERWSLQIREQQELGLRDHMDQIQVRNVMVAQVVPDAPFDVMTVRIVAQAVDYRVDARTGQRVCGSSRPETFAEYWSFLRRSGTQTQPGKPGLMEGNCPNCGGAIELNQSARCSYCGALLRSGEHDWVLAEITQACEWDGAMPSEVPGADAARGQDPEFNLQHLEDRASVMFWRRILCERAGNVRPLGKLAREDFLEPLGKRLAQEAAAPVHEWFGHCAVGSVQTLGVAEEDGWQVAAVEVRWSGNLFRQERGGEARDTRQQRAFRSLYVLGRKPDARLAAGEAVSSAHCPSCGAPESGGEGGACAFCGTVLNDGSRDWILLDNPAWIEPRAQALLQRMRRQGGLEQIARATVPACVAAPPLPAAPLMAWLVKMTLADGKVDPKERQLLTQAGEKLRVPPVRVAQMLAAAQAGRLEVEEPSSAEEGRQWLTALAQMALADGNLSYDERQLLVQMGLKVGLNRDAVMKLVLAERDRLYRESRQELRKAKMRKKNFGDN